MLIRVRKRSPWVEFANVIKALLIRETKTRIGKNHLGLVWILIQPITSVLMLGVLLAPLLGRTSGDVPYAFFMLCGFIGLNTFKGPLMSGMNAISSNEGLLVFRQVEPIDPFIARFVFEILSSTISFALFCAVGSWLGIELSCSHLFQLLYCLLITSLVGFGLGLALGIKSVKNKDLEKIVALITSPLMFVSAVIIPINSLPPVAQQYLLYNPIVHTNELLRNALFPVDYPVTDVNLGYPTLCAIFSLALGLALYRNHYHSLKQR